MHLASVYTLLYIVEQLHMKITNNKKLTVAEEWGHIYIMIMFSCYVRTTKASK